MEGGERERETRVSFTLEFDNSLKCVALKIPEIRKIANIKEILKLISDQECFVNLFIETVRNAFNFQKNCINQHCK